MTYHFVTFKAEYLEKTMGIYMISLQNSEQLLFRKYKDNLIEMVNS